MSHEIKTALERNVKAVTLRPSVGQGTAVTSVHLREGLACEVTEGPWTFTAGMTEKYGGTNAGPNPGVLGRGALGACLALGYAMWAARLEVPLASLDVEVHADYDVRGELGADSSVRPGYQAIRYIVSITSPAPHADVVRMVEMADRHSSWRDVIANPGPLNRELRVTTAAPTGA